MTIEADARQVARACMALKDRLPVSSMYITELVDAVWEPGLSADEIVSRVDARLDEEVAEVDAIIRAHGIR